MKTSRTFKTGVTSAISAFIGACGVGAIATAQTANNQTTHITIHADKATGSLSRLLTGACIEDVNHEIYGGLYSQMIYGESFQEPPAPGHIVGFDAYGGDWRADHGEIAVGASDGPKLIAANSEMTEGTAQVELFLPGKTAGPAGFIVKTSDIGVGADQFNGYEVTLDAAAKTLVLGRHRQNWEPILTVPCDVPSDSWITLTVHMTATTLTADVNGKPTLHYEDVEHPLHSGFIGLRSWRRPARFRRLSLQTGALRRNIDFEEPHASAHVSSMWGAVIRGAAKGSFEIERSKAFVGNQSQIVSFESGAGEIGIENRGLNRQGMAFIEGKEYEGSLWLRAQQSLAIDLQLETADGRKQLAQKTINVSAQDTWQRVAFKLTPTSTTLNGRFTFGLKAPGHVALGYVSLQPGAWGRFANLPVRRDVAEGMRAAGFTVVRYGGSMVNSPAYRWKKMIGPRERRQPYHGLWYPYSSNGWGIADFLNFSEAAGFLGIPDFNMDETPQDMGDFIEYAEGNSSTRWGKARAADGHAAPYHLRAIELGNEEAVDKNYWERFEPMAKAIWKKDPKLVLVVGDFTYEKAIEDPFNFVGTPYIHSLAAHQKILNFAHDGNHTVWFDVHVWNESADQPANIAGPTTLVEQLKKLSPDADFKLAVFELNANRHGVQRALATANALNELESLGDRLAVVCSANGLQVDHQNDNGWDQGLVFMSPSAVWFQPPYYIEQIYSRDYLPLTVGVDVEGSPDPSTLNIAAVKSPDGKIVQLQVVNSGSSPVTARITVESTRLASASATVTSLGGPLDAVNTAADRRILPTVKSIPHALRAGEADFTFAEHTFTLLRFH